MFGKFRNLFGGAPPDAGTPVPRSRTGVGGARRPAQPRSIKRDPEGRSSPSISTGGAGSTGGGGARGLSLGDGRASLSDARRDPAPSPAEVACPNCGEPMLAGWGSTCGKCRPNLVAPKTLYLAPGQAIPGARVAPGGMTLGWLVVVRTPDSAKRGSLVDLEHHTVVLSRAGAGGGPDELVAFEDSFMSSGHAVLRRPATGERTDAFTIRDRDNPAPSANGTFVNAHKLTPGEVVRLSDGDMIKLGATELLFKSLWLPPLTAPVS